MNDARRTSAAAQRNESAIADVLAEVLPAAGLVLEIASGSGEHVAAFSGRWPGLAWQPTDRDPEALASIDAWAAEAGRTNVRPALLLDVERWPSEGITGVLAVICINLVHIAPWSACVALMRGVAAVLPRGAPFYMYGPMKVGGEFTTESNAAFDRSLRSRDPAWGVRDLEAVEAEARSNGLLLVRTVAMPANNFSLVFTRG